MRIAILLVVLGACVRDDLVACDDGRLCPVGTVCWQLANPDELVCATREQLAQCEGVEPFGKCTAGVAPGRCYDGVCLEAGCGNARRDPDEACDDGNNFPGDGCAADCASDETCGNGVSDPISREQCDGGDTFSHDGCSGTCTTEAAAWSLVLGERPDSREAHGMVFDAVRSRVVMFGGAQSGIVFKPLDDMWEWNGRTWTRIPFAYGPSPRFGHAMAYDASRRRIVLFGGAVPDQSVAGQSEFDETWEWDGTSWSLIPTATRPPARVYGRMVYDSHRKRVVLFGGFDSRSAINNVHDDTWTWDGAAWTRLTGPGPDARYSHAMVYDPVRDVIVVAGGYAGGSLDDTWELDDLAWNQRANSPRGRHAASFAFDPVTRETVLFSGLSGTTELDDAIAFNGQRWLRTATVAPRRDSTMAPDPLRGVLVLFGGSHIGVSTDETYEVDTTWNLRTPTEPMIALVDAAATFDPRRARAVLFGGIGGGTDPSNRTYELDGDHWIVRVAIASPPGRYGHAMAFDLERNHAVLLGGRDKTSALLGDTWTWNGATWTPAGTGPTVMEHAMAYDAARARIVMFGGNKGTLSDETWTWNGTAWTQVYPLKSPSPRQSHAMAYDPIRARVVLYGGESGLESLTDLWEWDGASWTEISPMGLRPGARHNAGLVWNPARRRIVLIDGQNTAATVADAWEWDGTQWSLVSTMQTPQARTQLVAVPAADGSGILFFGGAISGAFGAVSVAETWRLRWSGLRTDDLCRDRADPDADGLAGCDDPDCWSVCTPLCAPGVSCALASPRCGDGTCNPLENCRLCPADCACASACGDFVCDPGETCPGDCP